MYIYIYIYIYMYCHPQTKCFYHNSSVWLDKRHTSTFNYLYINMHRQIQMTEP